MRSLGCRRFGRILNEVADREATSRERAFLDAHRTACESCRQEERAACLSLDLLRSASFETELEPSFDRRVVRRAKVEAVRDSVRYWSPALIGGAVAAGLLLAAVSAVTRPIAPGATAPVQAVREGSDSLALKDQNVTFTR
jgi:hypothetical protein